MSQQQESEEPRYTVLLGGIGGDSHSVGLTILRQALTSNGYRVNYLGTQNQLQDFLRLAGLCNVVMISSMDGHARYYLREFPHLISQFRSESTLWYLGGNLHIGDGLNCEAEFREMGFDRVFPKFVDLTTVLELLARDLHGARAVPDHSSLWERARPVSPYVCGGACDGYAEQEAFERERLEVLEGWGTGRGARALEANALFMRAQPSFAEAQARVLSGRSRILVQPRSGVPLVSEQIKIFRAFKGAGVPVLSYQVDSLTRNNDYAGAAEAIRESHACGAATLNGFPVVNHGVPSLRRIISEVKTPLQTRHSTRDPRLLAEISYAGGVTSFEGGAICYNIPYYKDYPLDASIRNWQYVDYLSGLYHKRFNIVLDREFFGTLTATLIPPCLAIVVCLIEALLAVRQGVKCVSLGYAEQGNRPQDIAAIRVLGETARRTLGNMGYKDVQVNTVFHQYMAAFPAAVERSTDLIFNSAVTAALSGAARVIGKTPVEAVRIPTLQDNLSGIGLIQRAVAEAAESRADEDAIERESEVLRREVENIFESIVYCGRGDIARGIVVGFAEGLLDVPFSPSVYNRGEVMTARDAEGAVRFLRTGKLQFDRDLREFHQDRMAERRRAEGLRNDRQDYLLVEKDVMRVARGQYERWPLYG
jgi:methylaspartate mutase epsilon subunit